MFAGISTSVFDPFFIMSFAVNLRPEGNPATLMAVCESASDVSGHWRYTPAHALVVVAGLPSAEPDIAAPLNVATIDPLSTSDVTNSAKNVIASAMLVRVVEVLVSFPGFAVRSTTSVGVFANATSSSRLVFQPTNTHPLLAVAFKVVFFLSGQNPLPVVLPALAEIGRAHV